MRKTRLPTLVCVSAIFQALLLVSPLVHAGTNDDEASKKIAEQVQKEPFPVTFFLRASVDSNYIFRGVDILPDKSLNLMKANVKAVNSVPGFSSFLTDKFKLTVPRFVDILAKTPPGEPSRVQVARSSTIGYFDATATAYGFTATGFYALQSTPRTDPAFFGRKSFFTEYKELDGRLGYSKTLGPVDLYLGGTYYHVEKNSDFDTAEMNFRVQYSPSQLQFLHASFSYDYAGSLHYPTYFDGHHLELAVTGDFPIREFARFNPYILVSAGAGIIPRAFNQLSLPTYFSDRAFAAGLAPGYEAVLKSFLAGGGVGGGASADTINAARLAFDPALLDRDFDLSNFEVGFSVPIYVYKGTPRLTLEPKAAYSRPLGNLQVYPYNQKDYIWGGIHLNVEF